MKPFKKGKIYSENHLNFSGHPGLMVPKDVLTRQSCFLEIFALRMFVFVRSVSISFAPSKFELVRSAFRISALYRIVWLKLASLRIASSSWAFSSLVPSKFAPLRSAPTKTDSRRSAPTKFVLLKFAPLKSAPLRSTLRRFAPTRFIYIYIYIYIYI